MSVIVPVVRARGWLERARGLIGRPAPAPGEAFWLIPCRQVHTFWMAYPIDVVVLDDAQVVLAVRTLAPWRVGPWRWRGHSTLELAAGEAARLGLVVGTQVEVTPRHS